MRSVSLSPRHRNLRRGGSHTRRKTPTVLGSSRCAWAAGWCSWQYWLLPQRCSQSATCPECVAIRSMAGAGSNSSKAGALPRNLRCFCWNTKAGSYCLRNRVSASSSSVQHAGLTSAPRVNDVCSALSRAVAILVLLVGLLLSIAPRAACAAGAPSAAPALTLPGLTIQLQEAHSKPQQTATAIKLLALLTVLTLAPAILIVMTSFTRIIIVLSMLRQASGMQDTPPNAVLLSLALILTAFTMTPMLEEANDQAFTPYMNGKISEQAAVTEALRPFREFMIRQTREQDVRLMLDIARAPEPAGLDDLRT